MNSLQKAIYFLFINKFPTLIKIFIAKNSKKINFLQNFNKSLFVFFLLKRKVEIKIIQSMQSLIKLSRSKNSISYYKN